MTLLVDDNAYNRVNRTSSSMVSGAFSRHKDISSKVLDIMIGLALCHNVSPVNEGNSSAYIALEANNLAISYQASSPDEVALVEWSKLVGLTLYARDSATITLVFDSFSNRKRVTLDYRIMHIFPFSSETKRMGMIVQDQRTREYTFYLKGADTIVGKLVLYNDWFVYFISMFIIYFQRLEEECGNMAREGLRTLVFARKRLSAEVFKKFSRRYLK